MSRKEFAPKLEALGLSSSEEATYRTLLSQPGATTPELSERTGLSAKQLSVAFEGLEAKGLVVRGNHPKGSFDIASPDLAMQNLVNRRRGELDRAGAAAAALIDELHEPRSRSSADMFEVVEGQEEVSQRTFQLLYNALREVMILSKPPYAVPIGGRASDVGRENIKRGVSYRVVFDHAAIEEPGVYETIREDVRAGSQIRVLDQVPLKLLISDRRVGLLAIHPMQPDIGTALVITSSSLLEALIVLFETVWERAVPLGLQPGTKSSHDLSEQDRELLALMAAGFKDDAIAARVGVTSRSIRRRLTRLMSETGASNRFQLAVEAMVRDWIAKR